MAEAANTAAKEAEGEKQGKVQKLAKADHAAAKAVVADARAQAGTDVTMGEKAVRLALKKGEAFSREDSKPPKYQLHE